MISGSFSSSCNNVDDDDDDDDDTGMDRIVSRLLFL